MTKSKARRPLALWLLVGCLSFLSLGGFIGGIAFVAEPSGKLLQMSFDLVEKSRLPIPIQDYFWPGVFLLLTFGVLPLVAAYSLLARPELVWAERLNLWPKEYWALTLCLLLGLVLVGWIIFEVILIGLSQFLQPLLAFLGIVIMGLVLLPSMREYYSARSLTTK